MRIAVAGKGGAGKTTIAATLARCVARTGTPVVAIDADSNPNLGLALGAGDVPTTAIPTALVSRKLHGPSLTTHLEDVLDAHASVAPDGVRLLHMGAPHHAEEGCMCAAHATVSALLADLGTRPETFVVVDMEASPEHFSRGTARHVDALCFVTEPYYRSLETARRMADLARELPIARLGLIGNKVRSPLEAEAVREFCDRHELEHLGDVPWSDTVVDADLARTPLIDAAPDGPAVSAIGSLASRLVEPAGVRP